MKNASQPSTTRDAILDAAERLMAKVGYKKMTIDDLASEVGIGKGSVYLHFASKDEIALSHIDRIIEGLKIRLHAIADSARPVDKKLKDMLVERVIYRFDSVQLYTQSLDELLAKLRPQLLDRRRQYFQQEAKIFAQVVADGQAEGGLATGSADDMALTLLSATNSLLPYSLSTIELGHREAVAERTRKTADMLIKGIRR